MGGAFRAGALIVKAMGSLQEFQGAEWEGLVDGRSAC